MKAIALGIAVVLLTGTSPAVAQSMGGMNMPGMAMPGMKMPMKKPVAKKKPAAKGAAKAPAKKTPAKIGAPAARASAKSSKPAEKHDKPAMPGMSGMPGMDMPASRAGQQDMSQMPGMSAMPKMSGMPGMDKPASPAEQQDMSQMPGMSGMAGMNMGQPAASAPLAGTALPAGNAPAPAPPADHYADRIYAPDAMAGARGDLRREHGGSRFSMVLFNLAEFQFRNGRDGYRWDGEGWYGGDINRLVVKSEGEGAFRGGLESAEAQALYSHAIGPYFNLQAGVRQDFKPTPRRTYATVGIEGLAPGFFEVEGAAFLSNKGDILGRLEGYYDQRITQRLILQPRAELNLSAQDVPEIRLGSGLTNAELGLRLRYEIKRELAPYVGLSYDRKFGDTSRFARADGEDRTAKSVVLGVRTWF